MDQSEFKTERECVSGKCCSAVYMFSFINNYEFKALFNINSTIDRNRYDKFVSLSKQSKLTANLNKKDFFTEHLNTRSLSKSKNRIDDLLIDLERMLDVIAISEAKLNANSSLNLNLPSYKFIRHEFFALAGGVGLRIKDSLEFIARKDLSLDL